MSRLQSFTTASSTSIAAEQPHRKTQIQSVKLKADRCHQPNICVAPPFLHLHSQPTKLKSVTGPLNEAVRAMLCGNLATTNGSAIHCRTSDSDNDIDTKSLADMIYSYWTVDEPELQGKRSPSNATSDFGVDAEESNSPDELMAPFLREKLCQMLEGLYSSTGTAFESCLLQDAAKALAMAKEKTGFNALENGEQKSGSRRFVMNTLRFAGYNAAICKSQWEQTKGHPAGDYEFIDVVTEGSKLENERFFVDIDFKAQFEIARPSDEYNALLERLPVLFVGRADKLCGIVKIMCDAARRSLQERGMYIPPWRKYRYMQAKWMGAYKRTTNPGSRAAPGAFLEFPFAGITLNATEFGGGVVHQMEKPNSAADRNIMAKSKSVKQGNEKLGFRDRLVSKGQRARYENKISGLATALAEAGLIPSCPSN